MAKFILSSILYLIISQLIPIFGQKLMEKNSNCKFCRDENVGVVFTPFVSIEDVLLNNRYNLTDLQPFISKIGTEFKIVYTPIYSSYISTENSLHTIPMAIATWNAKQSLNSSQSNNLLESWLFLDEKSSRITSKQFFPSVKNIAEEANQIHSNTVTSILLPCTILFQLTTDSFSDKFLIAREHFPKTKYKLGVYFDAKWFSHFINNWNYTVAQKLNNNFDEIDSVMFDVGIVGSKNITIPVKTLAQESINLIKNNIEFIKDHCSKILSYSIVARWPDTTDSGHISYSRLVQFWEEMVAYGKSEDITIIFNGAFDYPFEGTPDKTTSGWWRLKENSSYTSTFQFEFQNKLTLTKKDLKSDKYLISKIQDDVTFDRKNFILGFSPNLNHSQLLSNQPFLPNMMKKVSSKFDWILINQKDMNELDSNKIFYLAGKHNEEGILSLSIIYFCKANLKSFEVRMVIEQIVKINTIYPNLIKEVLFPSRISGMSVGSIRSGLNPSGTKSDVKVGIMFSIWMCRGSWNQLEDRKMEENINNVDVAYFSYIPGFANFYKMGFGIERVLSQVVALFENCQRRVGNVIPWEKVGFRTGFSDSLGSMKEKDFVSLTIFWKKMNAWATKTNSRVIMEEAFDMPRDGKPESYGHKGWWRLSHNINSSNTFYIEEKRIYALKSLQNSLRIIASQTGVNREKEDYLVTEEPVNKTNFIEGLLSDDERTRPSRGNSLKIAIATAIFSFIRLIDACVF